MAFSPALGIAAAVLLVAFLLAFVATRVRTEVWERFAKRHGLVLRESAGERRMEGTIEGRPVWLRQFADASDTEVRGVILLEFGAAIEAELPRDLVVRDVTGPIGSLDRAVREADIETGDPAFDEAAHVVGADADQVRAWLTPERRAGIVAFFEAARPSFARVTEVAVAIQRRKVLPDAHALEKDRDLLLRTAASLESNAHTEPGSESPLQARTEPRSSTGSGRAPDPRSKENQR